MPVPYIGHTTIPQPVASIHGVFEYNMHS